MNVGDIKKILKKKKQLIIIACGLLFAFILIRYGDKKTENTAVSDSYSEYMSIYASELETKLEKLIDGLDGVSDVSVVVYLESGKESVYAKNGNESEANVSEQYVSIGNEALLLKELVPKVSGVAVVCRSSKSSVTEAQIVRLLSSLLDIKSNHIYVSS